MLTDSNLYTLPHLLNPLHAGPFFEVSLKGHTPFGTWIRMNEIRSALHRFAYLQNIWSRGSWFCSTYKRQSKTQACKWQRLGWSKSRTNLTTRTILASIGYGKDTRLPLNEVGAVAAVPVHSVSHSDALPRLPVFLRSSGGEVRHKQRENNNTDDRPSS